MNDLIIYRDHWHIFQNDFRAHPDWRKVSWGWAHADFDGAPDANDSRYGWCESVEACKREIDLWEEENGID